MKDTLDGGSIEKEFHIIGDGAFPLSVHMMKPFAGTSLTDEKEQFNYRLSRARMTIENAFGRLKARWRVLLRFSELGFKKTVKVISTCCILHNLCENEKEFFCPTWLNEVKAFEEAYPQPGNEDSLFDNFEGEEKRNFLVELLNS